LRNTTLIAAVLLAPLAIAAPGRDLEHSQFLDQGFDAGVPKPATLTVGRELRAELETVLGHRFGQIRVRYWQSRGRTGWILDEIGKTEPITVGVGVEGGRITNVQVLEFRESRGWEVRYPFFTDQFAGAVLDGSSGLDRHIDGITGATLSVSAVSKVARLALILDRQVRHAAALRSRAEGS
jgi:hypothetical protein